MLHCVRFVSGAESTAGGGAAPPRFLRQAGGPARHQRRSPASRAADIVPDIQRLASGSRLRLSWLVFPPSNSSEKLLWVSQAVVQSHPKSSNMVFGMTKLCLQQTSLRSYGPPTQNKHHQIKTPSKMDEAQCTTGKIKTSKWSPLTFAQKTQNFSQICLNSFLKQTN